MHVDFELTEEQETLRDVSRSLLTAACPPELVRSVQDNGSDLDDKLWERGTELGWTLLAVPEEQDGAGADLRHRHLDRGGEPGVRQQRDQQRREHGPAGVAGLLAFDGAAQGPDEGADIDVGTAEDQREVVIGCVRQAEHEMLGRHLVVSTRDGDSGSTLERPPAERRQPVEQLAQIQFDHRRPRAAGAGSAEVDPHGLGAPRKRASMKRP